MADDEPTGHQAAIIDELYADYPVARPTARPARRRITWRWVVTRVLMALQGMTLGLMLAILMDQTWGLATPLPTMVSIALIRMLVWPYRHELATRAMVARVVACNLVAFPLVWWPR